MQGKGFWNSAHANSIICNSSVVIKSLHDGAQLLLQIDWLRLMMVWIAEPVEYTQ